jgi:hypothetical protein
MSPATAPYLVPTIPADALIASEAFGALLSAESVAAAIGAGLIGEGAPVPEVCPLEGHDGEGVGDLGALLGRLDFDGRLGRARALIIAVPAIDPHALQRAPAFELATRARQRGVPAYAILACATLDLFDARMLDLQTVLLAGSEPELRLAGARLAALL